MTDGLSFRPRFVLPLVRRSSNLARASYLLSGSYRSPDSATDRVQEYRRNWDPLDAANSTDDWR